MSTGTMFDENVVLGKTTQTDQGSYKYTDGSRPNHVNRQCLYRNLYYRWTDQTFHYFATPEETALWREDARVRGGVESPDAANVEDVRSSMNVSIGLIPENLPKVGIKKRKQGTPWRPILHEHNNDDDDDDNNNNNNNNHDDDGITYAIMNNTNTVLTLYHPFHGTNFGHLLWDDLLAIYSLVDRFFGGGGGGGSRDDDTVDTMTVVPLFVELPDPATGWNYGGPDRQWRCSPGGEPPKVVPMRPDVPTDVPPPSGDPARPVLGGRPTDGELFAWGAVHRGLAERRR
jgi:hypothetical protein